MGGTVAGTMAGTTMAGTMALTVVAGTMAGTTMAGTMAPLTVVAGTMAGGYPRRDHGWHYGWHYGSFPHRYGYDYVYPYGYGYGYGAGLAGLATAPLALGAAVTEPLMTGRSVAASGNYCATPVKTCLLHEPGWVGTGCSCKVYGGRARGTVQ